MTTDNIMPKICTWQTSFLLYPKYPWQSWYKSVFSTFGSKQGVPPSTPTSRYSKIKRLHYTVVFLQMGWNPIWVNECTCYIPEVCGELPRVIGYGSRALTGSKEKYHSSKLDFLAFKWAICGHFKDYLFHSPTFWSIHRF